MLPAYFHIGHVHPFLDNDTTVFRVIQDFFIFMSFVALTWDLQAIFANRPVSAPPARNHGVTKHTPILYALTFTARLSEYYPFDFLSYDLATCSGFATIFWISVFFHVCAARKTSSSSLPPVQILSMKVPIELFHLHVMVAITAILAYFFNYAHLKLTLPVFLWAWSHYLESVAMLPQLWFLLNNSEHSYGHVWTAINLMAASRLFELADWVYLYLSVDMLDPLAVASAFLYLASYVSFRIIFFFKKRFGEKDTDVIGDDPLLSDLATLDPELVDSPDL